MDWKVSFFNEKVYRMTLAFPKGILAHFLHVVEMVEQFGPFLGMPYTKALGKGLYEIRVKGKEGIGRSFFCTISGNEVVILHSYIKKTNKTPKKDLDIARKRLKEAQEWKK